MKATVSEVKSLVEDLFLRPGQKSAIRPDADLLATGICDSMGLVNLAQALEQRFGIAVKDSEVTRAHLGSIHRVTRFLSKKGVQVDE